MEPRNLYVGVRRGRIFLSFSLFAGKIVSCKLYTKLVGPQFCKLRNACWNVKGALQPAFCGLRGWTLWGSCFGGIDGCVHRIVFNGFYFGSAKGSALFQHIVFSRCFRRVGPTDRFSGSK